MQRSESPAAGAPAAPRSCGTCTFCGVTRRENRAISSARQRNPLSKRNALRRLHATKKIGFHAFRRFRTEVLRRARVPEDLLRLWLGHSKESVTDFYADGLKNDSAWRKEWTARAGLGFSVVGLHGLQNAVSADVEKAA